MGGDRKRTTSINGTGRVVISGDYENSYGIYKQNTTKQKVFIKRKPLRKPLYGSTSASHTRSQEVTSIQLVHRHTPLFDFSMIPVSAGYLL